MEQKGATLLSLWSSAPSQLQGTPVPDPPAPLKLQADGAMARQHLALLPANEAGQNDSTTWRQVAGCIGCHSAQGARQNIR